MSTTGMTAKGNDGWMIKFKPRACEFMRDCFLHLKFSDRLLSTQTFVNQTKASIFGTNDSLDGNTMCSPRFAGRAGEMGGGGVGGQLRRPPTPSSSCFPLPTPQSSAERELGVGRFRDGWRGGVTSCWSEKSFALGRKNFLSPTKRKETFVWLVPNQE